MIGSSPIETVDKSLFFQKKEYSSGQETSKNIWVIAKKIFFYLLGTLLFLSNPTIFSIGVITGIVWTEKADEIIVKIRRVCQKLPWEMATLTGITAFLAIQVTWGTTAFLYAAELGARLSNKAKKM